MLKIRAHNTHFLLLGIMLSRISSSSSFLMFHRRVSSYRVNRTFQGVLSHRIRQPQTLRQETTELKNYQSYDQDTIFALSSGQSVNAASAVAVIRVSGPASGDVLQKLMENTGGKMPKPRYAALRKLSVPHFGVSDTGNFVDYLDDALVLYFPSNNSFTGEETVEIQCHGSRGVVSGILDCLSNSFPNEYRLRPADRGEFTQRAYETGRLNLLQVEALADLIVSETKSQRRQALKELSKKDSSYLIYDKWRGELTKALAHAEAVIDFGDDDDIEEEEEVDVWANVRVQIADLKESMERHLKDDNRGEIIREGVQIAILGPPNAGKSTLLNYLARRDVAIVSDIAGTTRDVVEVSLDLGGVKCVVSDTAGLREQTSDQIEIEGMKRAKAIAEQAHFKICVVDASDTEGGIRAVQNIIDEEGYEKHSMLSENTVFVANKIDLVSDSNNVHEKLVHAVQDSVLTSKYDDTDKYSIDAYQISCSKDTGVDEFLDSLTSKIQRRLTNDDQVLTRSNGGEDSAIITRARHRSHVKNAVKALTNFESLSLQGFWALDLAAEELRLAASELGRVVGAVDVEDVLDVLFADFCIGK